MRSNEMVLVDQFCLQLWSQEEREANATIKDSDPNNYRSLELIFYCNSHESLKN